MKRLTAIFLLFITVLSAGNCYTQWVEQFSGTSSHFYDVKFINQNTGWASGDGGNVIKTTNGGINWISYPTGVTVTILTGIHPVNENVIYAVGYWRTLLKSTNGGVNWQIISNMPMGQGISFKEVFFINENTGWWVSEFSSFIFKTSNGMNTIDSFSNGSCGVLDIYFKDELNGITMSIPPVCVFKTTNGGVNWNQTLVPAITCSPPFYQMTFVNGLTGFVVPRSTCNDTLGHMLYRTTNFGNSWDTISHIKTLPLTDIYGLFFSSLNTGWAAGSNTRIYKTTNGGFNWYQQVTPSVTLIQKLAFSTDSIGWGVGNNGKILYTSSGGQFVGIKNNGLEVNNDYLLYQNYPNPFNPVTKINYILGSNDLLINITVFDSNGKMVKVLVNKKLNRGVYETEFNGINLASGIYFYTITINNEIKETKKMLLLK